MYLADPSDTCYVFILILIINGFIILHSRVKLASAFTFTFLHKASVLIYAVIAVSDAIVLRRDIVNPHVTLAFRD